MYIVNDFEWQVACISINFKLQAVEHNFLTAPFR